MEKTGPYYDFFSSFDPFEFFHFWGVCACMVSGLEVSVSFLFLFFKNKFILFVYFWLCCVFVAARGLSLVAVSGDYSSLRCAGFSLPWLLLLWSTGSRHVGFSSCGTRAQ